MRHNSLDLERTGALFTQVARGQAYAHRRGVIHRDLKPSNIMFDDAGNAYLTDFGLAKLMESSVELTRDGHIVGTPAYMSPEQLRGDVVDTRSDIYSMGVILYHTVVGRPPFESSDANMVTVIYGHLEKAPPPPRQTNPLIPAAVEEVILKSLQKRPADRYQTMEEMLTALQQGLGQPVQAVTPGPEEASTTVAPVTTVRELVTPLRPATPVPASAPVKKKQRGLWAGAAAILAMTLLAIVIVVMVVQQYAPRPAQVRPTIEPGSIGTANDAIPTSGEIAQAARALGSEGFLANIACTQDSEYHATQIREMRDLAEGYGLDFHVYDSERDWYREITLIERARTEGASALIVCPLNNDLLDGALASVQQAAIPLALFASDMSSYGGVLLAGDDYQMGLKAGRAGGDLINELFNGQGEILILDYPDLAYLVTRANGLRDGALQVAPDSVIVANRRGGTLDNGYESVKAALEEGLEFNTILSMNDAGSFGAIKALEEAGIDPAMVAISSVDAEALAREYIRDGHYLRASVSVNRALFAQAAINAVVKMLAGSPVPETLVVAPGEVITAANVDTES